MTVFSILFILYNIYIIKIKGNIMIEGVIALVGTGKGGLALLKVLLDIPGVKIKYVCDINPDSVGYIFAENHNIHLRD